jgi:hypothetical protein
MQNLSSNFVVLTATQAVLGPCDSPANRAAHRHLVAKLAGFVQAVAGARVECVSGFYRGVADGVSYLIDLSDVAPAARDWAVRALRELAGEYGQESILTQDGLFTPEGVQLAVVAGPAIVGDEARAQDFYSVRQDGTAFSLPLAFLN